MRRERWGRAKRGGWVVKGAGGRYLAGLAPGEAVFKRSELAIVDAVEAIHAAAVVNRLSTIDVNARRLALMLAKVAALAL